MSPEALQSLIAVVLNVVSAERGLGVPVAAKILAQTGEVCYVYLNRPATPLLSGMRNPGGFFIVPECYP